jgi:hypothetical protein
MRRVSVSTDSARIPALKLSQLQPIKLIVWCSNPEGYETAFSMPAVGANYHRTSGSVLNQRGTLLKSLRPSVCAGGRRGRGGFEQTTPLLRYMSYSDVCVNVVPRLKCRQMA